jgi:putative ABC transport system substrate-binding protein
MVDPPYRPGMDRRRFLLTSLAGALVTPLAAEAQRGKVSRIGFLGGGYQHRLPSICQSPGFAERGGLLQYGADILDLFRRSATQVDKILKGAKPVEQPTKVTLIVNLKTAKALGLTIPPSLLVRADQVIE